MTSVYQRSDSNPPPVPSQVQEKRPGDDCSLQEETLQQMEALIKENKDVKDALKQNNSSMKEHLEELLTWKECQVQEKKLLQEKLMEAMQHVAALTKTNEEQQRAAVAEYSELESLKGLVARLKAEKTELVAINSELQLKLSQSIPADFAAAQVEECAGINQAHDLLISQKNSTFCTMKREEMTVTQLLQSLKMETEKAEKLHRELQAVRSRMLDLESWTYLKDKNSGSMENKDHCCRSNASTNMDRQIQLGPSVTGDGSSIEVESLKVQTQTLVKDLQGLQYKLQDSEDMKKSLHDKCRDIDQERSQLTAQLVKRQQQYVNMESQLEEKQQENKKLKAHLEEKQQENKMLRAQLVEKQQGNEKMESQLEEKQQQYEKMESQLEEKQRQHEKMESQLAEKQEGIEQMESQLEEKQQQYEKMESQLEEKQRQYENMKSQLEEKQRQYEKMESQLAEKQEGIEQMESQLEEKQQQYEKMESQLEEKQRQYENMKSQLEEKQRQYEKMESQLKEGQQENEMLKIQLDSMSSCMKAAQNKAEEGRQDLAQLKDAHDQLYEEYIEMQKQIRENKEEVNGLIDRVGAAEEALATKQQKIDEMKQEIFKKEEELETISVFKAQAEVYSSDFYAERKAREKIHEEKELLAEELNNIKKENMQLQEQIESLGRQTLEKLRHRHVPVPHGAGPPGGNVKPAVSHTMDIPDFQCPKCNEILPDMDSLNIHTMECIT